MPDPNETQTPPAATPAATTTPPAATAPPAAAAAATRPPRAPNGGKGENVPPGAFLERVRREAAKQVREQLGVSAEEAKRIIAEGGRVIVKGTEAQAATATANQAIEKLQSENQRLKKQVNALTGRATQAEQRLRKTTQRLTDKQIETELKFYATSAQIVDPDYAVTLFARAAAAGQATDPQQFFAGLRGTHPHLFKSAEAAPAAAAPAPVATAPKPTPVAATTAPPESGKEGQTKPAQGATGATVNTDSMSPQDFSAHTRSRYGFVPGV